MGKKRTAPVVAALAQYAAPALAAWRADPDWAKRCIGSKYPDDLIHGVAHLIAALRNDPVALRDAVAVVARNGAAGDIHRCLAALDADGWGLLADEERGALWTRALRDHPAALGFVWSALSDGQREAAAQRAAANDGPAAALISRIGARRVDDDRRRAAGSPHRRGARGSRGSSIAALPPGPA